MSRQKRDAKWSAYGGVLTGEGQHASLSVDPKRSDVVAALITGIQEIAARVQSEKARIITLRQGVARVIQFSVSCD